MDWNFITFRKVQGNKKKRKEDKEMSKVMENI